MQRKQMKKLSFFELSIPDVDKKDIDCGYGDT